MLKRNKFIKLSEVLEKNLVGKKEVIRNSLLAMLVKENVLLVGPPGTAKSEIARRLSNVVKEGKYFEYLLTQYTTPEELFGPVSLMNLKKDIFIKNTEGYLSSVNIAFLDEIFKANSSILNSLLTIMNERIYHNGNKKENSEIISIVGASNELPTDESLLALYDRFLFRIPVGYLKHEADQLELMDLKREKFEIPEYLKFTLEEIEEINSESEKVEITLNVKRILLKMINNILPKYEGEYVSDRKLVKIIHLLKVSAYLNGRNVVTINDMNCLPDCIWNKIENRINIKNEFFSNL